MAGTDSDRGREMMADNRILNDGICSERLLVCIGPGGSEDPGSQGGFQEYVDHHILPEQTQQTLDIDMELDFQQINKRLLNELKRLAPHGPGNSKPLFITRNVFDYGTSKVVGRHQEHIKLELVDSKSAVVMNGIAFGQSAAARYIKSKRSFDIVYTIEENTYKRGEVQLQIEGIRPSDGEGIDE